MLAGGRLVGEGGWRRRCVDGARTRADFQLLLCVGLKGRGGGGRSCGREQRRGGLDDLWGTCELGIGMAPQEVL